MRHVVTVMMMLLATTSMVPAAAAGPSGGAYAGTHVSFDVSGDAVANYTVDGEPMLASVEMRSANASGDASGSGDANVGASLDATVDLDGVALSLGARTATSATVTAEGSGSMTAHDNPNGVLVVSAADGAQYVRANLSDGAKAQERSDRVVTVTSANGTTGSFVLVGDGNVTVDGEGNVSAEVGEDGRLVFRSYPNGRDASDERQERLIADGVVAGEVHVMERDGETVTDAVSYGANTTVEAKRTAENGVEVTVERAEHDGKVIITSVSKAAAKNADLRVTVDGEAAAKASSYGELRSAIGGERSAYMVEQGTAAGASAEASADVLVAVNHFSTRTIGIQPTDAVTTDTTSGDTTAGDTSDSGTTTNDAGQPGFGVSVALAALLAVAFVVIRRH